MTEMLLLHFFCIMNKISFWCFILLLFIMGLLVSLNKTVSNIDNKITIVKLVDDSIVYTKVDKDSLRFVSSD